MEALCCNSVVGVAASAAALVVAVVVVNAVVAVLRVADADPSLGPATCDLAMKFHLFLVKLFGFLFGECVFCFQCM